MAPVVFLTSPSRWLLFLGVLFALACFVWLWRPSHPGPLPWGKPWDGKPLETGADADRKGLDDGDELERDSRWEPWDRE